VLCLSSISSGINEIHARGTLVGLLLRDLIFILFRNARTNSFIHRFCAPAQLKRSVARHELESAL
jgi:hypothetical protein